MNHARLADLLEKYVEGDLPDGERAELEGLLKGSPAARRYFWSYLHQHALLRKLMAEAKGRAIARRDGRRPRVFLVAAAAAGILVGLAGGVLLTSRPTAEDRSAPKPVVQAASPTRAPEEPPAPAVEERPSPAEAPPKPVEPPAPVPEKRDPRPPSPSPEERPRTEAEPPNPPAPKPPPEEIPPPAKPAPPPPKPTIVVVAQVEQVLGQARVFDAPEPRVKAGQDVLSGQGIEVAARESLVVLRCADGTRVELGPGSRMREFRDEGGKRIVLERGLLSADVSKQPAGRSMAVVTPHAEARIGGTRFVLWALPESTRLEVREGRVRVTRRDDPAAAEVGADQRLTVAKGAPLAARPARVSDDLVALYRFDTGPVDQVRDVSASGVPLDIDLKPDGGAAFKPTGLSFQRWGRISSHGPATKILQACRKSRELTLEAWVVPDKASFRYAGFLILLGDPGAPNAALLQGVSSPSSGPYQAQLRTSVSDPDRHAALSTPKNLVEGRLTHVVYARASTGQERLYVDGVPRAVGVRGGDFSAWKDDARLSFGLEWLGEYRLVAVYARALKETEVVRNFRLGVE